LGLPYERSFLLCAAAIGGIVDQCKGADLLLCALQRVRSHVNGTLLEQLELLVFGKSRSSRRAKEQRTS
jgi:hypothetical protein